MADHAELRAFAESLADVARAAARAHFRSGLAVEQKDDRSPVTLADREIEAALRDRIRRRYPSHGILGEEYGAEDAGAEFVWVLDPIDGTKAFATGKPLFGTLIGVTHARRPVVGVIESPITAERWVGVEGAETTLNGAVVRVRSARTLSGAVLYAGNPDMYEGPARDGLERLRRAVMWTNWDCDCYAYGLLALGAVDVVVENKLTTSDFCALVPVVRGARGVITDWGGAELHLGSDGSVIAASSAELAYAARRLLCG